MSRVEDICEDTKGIQISIERRAAATNGQSDSAALEQKLTTSIVKKVSNLAGVDCVASTLQYDKIGASGTAAGTRSQLVAAVDGKFNEEGDEDRPIGE